MDTMSERDDNSTQERIVDAAREAFVLRGFDGARMQDIADRAGINKAMLHYYFRSKQQLFNVVFRETLGKFQSAFVAVLQSDKPFVEKIRTMVEKDIDMLVRHPEIPMFVLTEMSRRSHAMEELAIDAKLPELLKEFSRQAKAAARRKEIRNVDPLDLFLNILALNRFPFIAHDMLTTAAGITEKKFNLMMTKRKRSVADLLINDLMEVES